MMFKAYIASNNALISRMLNAACASNHLTSFFYSEHTDLMSDLQQSQPDVLFLDTVSIDVDLYSFIRQLRDDETFSSLYVVLVSRKKISSGIIHESGADASLCVPFSKTQFNAVTRNILKEIRQVLIATPSVKEISVLYKELVTVGYEVYIVQNVEEMLELTRRIIPDLILCNEILEDLTAVDVCKQLQEQPAIKTIPLMVLAKDCKAEVIEAYLDAGARNVLFLPLNMNKAMSKISVVAPPPQKGRRLRALVIDDSSMVRNLICTMFKHLGYLVVTAVNGKEGLTAALKFKPDIITCDYDMPVMSGWEFCVAASRDDSINYIPIIMVTARGANVDKQKGKVLGIAGYLTKPFNEADLTKSIAGAVAAAKLRMEREALSKYISTDTLKNVSDVIDGVKEKTPEDKFITIFFSDIRSFTPKCERLGAAEIVSLLNSYFTKMIKVLQKNNAIIDKLIGDAIVARFDSGFPEKDALDAARAALQMLAALDEFNKDSLEPIEIRIGINSGNVILGNIGSDGYRLDYTMIGDNVNIAQRLESQAPVQGCLLASSTYSLIKNLVDVGGICEFALKGKKEKVEAYSLLGLKGQN